MDIIVDILEICIPLGFFGFIAVFFFEIRPRHIKQFIEAPAEKLPVIPLIEKSKVKSTYFGTTGLIFFVGLLIVGTDAITFYDQVNTSDWEEIPATVSISEIREYETCGEDGCSRNDYPYIKYSYFVDGESYSNDDIVLFDLDEGNFGFSISLVDQHPKGSEVTAYYNPENPDHADTVRASSISIESKFFLIHADLAMA